MVVPAKLKTIRYICFDLKSLHLMAQMKQIFNLVSVVANQGPAVKLERQFHGLAAIIFLCQTFFSPSNICYTYDRNVIFENVTNITFF